MLPWIALAPAYATTLDFADRSEVMLLDAGDFKRPSLVVGNNPSVRLRLASRSWQHSASYYPLVTMHDTRLGENPGVFHAGSISTAWQDRTVRVSLTETARYGDRVFLGYLPTGQESGQRYVMKDGRVSPVER